MEQQGRRISDLRPGEPVDQVFLVQSKDLRRTPTGAVYAAFQLSDRTGMVDARWWQATEAGFEALPLSGFVRVKGKAQSHRGQLQLHLESIEPVEAGEIADFWPAAERDVEEMWAELRTLLATIENHHVRRLVEAFLDDESIAARFKRVPAGTQLHHNVVGGALEHTLSVVRLAQAVHCVYGPALNRDLLLAGAFLHDIGKAEEMSAETTFRYTDRGNLVGHITLAAIWIQQKADALSAETGTRFPDQILDLIQHLVLSHHGTRERGSPKPPMIPEAVVLHALDDLDTRVYMARSAIEQDRDAGASFTAYHKNLDVKVYKRSRELPGEEGEGRG